MTTFVAVDLQFFYSASALSAPSPKMSLLCCPQISPQVTWCKRMHHVTFINGIEQQSLLVLRSFNTEILGQGIAAKASKIGIRWSSLGGSRVVPKTNFQRNINNSKAFIVSASWFTMPQIASNVFTWGTVSVLPFYSFMVLAPSSTLTRRVMESNLPYVALGVVYAYSLYLSWTPDTLRLMFASKYWLPELPGISKMFMNEMTMASAWIHLLAVDLYAARQVFYDGMKNNIETRHSVSLCLLFCPIGILVHAITKLVTKIANHTY